jgi:ADP-dependent NAD(P)H-hydrate dehydratase / NAD(P)H-hydrate epimerase
MNTFNFRRQNPNSTFELHGEPVLASDQVRALEGRFPNVDLMRRAGRAAAEFLFEHTTPDASIVLFAGPGNNGGDALACAAELATAGYAPTVILLTDPEKYGEDAKRAHQRVAELVQAAPVSPVETGRIGVIREMLQSINADWIVDGLFGIGLKRPLDGAFRAASVAINEARKHGATVFALDVPSGIDADTGHVYDHDACVVADYTMTFIAYKPGLVTGPALDYVGDLHLADLALDWFGDTAITAHTVTKAHFLTGAKANAHKGTHGTCVIVGGANGMLGAALLASRAAMRMGAGKVKVAWLAAPFPQVDPLMPEVMMRSLGDNGEDGATALVVGPGMGISGAAVRALKAQLKREPPVVIDADALNLVAESAELAKLVQSREKQGLVTVITPHPAEAARMLGASTASVQSDRLRAARDLARGYRCIVVLKGAGTVVDDGGSVTINTTGNPLLATAGTGDVLAGVIGALLAQGHSANDAARVGVALHGAAADALAERGVTRAVASDVIAELATL